MVLCFACMNMDACMLMPKLCSCCFPRCFMCGQQDVWHPLFSKVCRVSRKCHAFGISVRTTTRCLSHYRRLWHRKGWLHGKSSLLELWLPLCHLPLHNSNVFFVRPGKRKQNQNSNRNFVVHIFVYQMRVQVV